MGLRSPCRVPILVLAAVLWQLVDASVFGERIRRENPPRCYYYRENVNHSEPKESCDRRHVPKMDKVREVTPDSLGTLDNDYVLKDHDSYDIPWPPPIVERSKRQLATTANTLEMLLVLDKAAYDKFLARNGGQAFEAQQEIARYFAGLVKEVNERFAKMDGGGFSLRVILTRIITLTTAAESSVTESLVSNGVVNSDAALDNFQILDNDVLQADNPHDYAVLVTGYDLRNGDINTIGVTFLYAACDVNFRGRDSRQGVIEDLGDEQTAATLAHEIGHAVGAVHDGQGNNCQNLYYVMAASAGTPTSRSLAENPFRFSSCSQTEIRTFVAGSSTSCLRSRQTTPGSEVNIAALTTVELGQRYDADTQCRQSFGANYRFCRTQYTSDTGFTFDDMCYDLRCGREGSRFCSSTLAFDGTSCGDGKWCQDGRCVVSALAPSTPSSTCPQGDDPTEECNLSVCSVALFRDTLCCATCQQGQTTLPPSPTRPRDPVVVSIAGVTTSTAAPPTPGEVSVAGERTTTPVPPTPGEVSVAGPTAVTTTPPPPGEVSVAGPAVVTTTPPSPPQVSVAGATRPTGTTASVSVAGGGTGTFSTIGVPVTVSIAGMNTRPQTTATVSLARAVVTRSLAAQGGTGR